MNWKPHPKQLEFLNREGKEVLFTGTYIPGSASGAITREVIRRFCNMPKYEIDDKMANRIENDYMYHSPTGDQPERYQQIRQKAKELAVVICSNTPPSREQSVALTELDHVVMMANAAIARNEK